MTTRPKDDLERVAESLADSADVDWPALEREHPEWAGTLAPLRALERLAAAHREAREGAGEPPREPARFTWGPLEVQEKIGEGAFGEVYRARDPSLQRDVALKLRREGAGGPSRAWLEEARRLARVSHPNVLAVLGVDEHGGRAGLWTELVRGETLEARLVREGPLPANEAALVGVDLCRALAAVHGVRVLHGDLKTTNVMREGGPGAAHPGRIVLMDFGAGQDGPPASPTTWTPLASAPEILRGGHADAASDQYALGALLYRLLTARYPFEAGSIAELLERSESSAPPPLRELRPDLPRELHDAVLRALAHDPAARFPNLSALERALSRALDPVAAARPVSRRMAAVAVAALLVAAAAILLLRPSRLAPGLVTLGQTPAPAPLEVSAALLRRTATGSEPLVDGGTVHAGDRLVLDLRVSEPVWAYVLDEDAAGSAFALFPLDQLDARNPLDGGRMHRLPGPLHGREFAWQVGESGGSETILVVAARQAQPRIESLLASLAPARAGEPAAARTGSPAPVGASARVPGEVTRGVDGLVPEPASPAASGPVTRLARELERAREPGVWVMRVRAVHGRP